MVVQYLSHWVRSLLFLIMDRLLRDNEEVVIMYSFLIRGARIMETGHFSFHMSFLGRLYHLITWHGGFNSRPGPVYFGMGRVSQWAELPYWVCASTPFIRTLFGLAPWACTLGLFRYYFLPHQLLPQLLAEASLGKG